MDVVTFFVWNKFKIVNSVIQAVIVINILTELIVTNSIGPCCVGYMRTMMLSNITNSV